MDRRAFLERALAASVLAMRSDKGSTVGVAIPSWVPSPGHVAPISLNTLSELPPLANEQSLRSREGRSALIATWVGLAVAPQLGVLGSLVGGPHGGHASYDGNQVLRYDIASRVWSFMSQPTYPIDESEDVPGGSVPHGRGSGWGEFAPGQPSTAHTYNYSVVVPPGSAAGGPKGALVQPVRAATFRSAIDFVRAHKFDLNQSFDSAKWTRLSTNTTSIGNLDLVEGGACYDGDRDCIWILPALSGKLGRLDCSTGRYTTYASTFATTGGRQRSLRYIKSKGAVVCVYYRPVSSDWRLAGFHAANPAAGFFDLINVSPDLGNRIGDRSGNISVAMDYVPFLDKIVIYNDRTHTNKLFWLAPPVGDAFKGTWTLTEETLAGSVIPGRPNTAGGPYTLFQWVPSIRCVIGIFRYNGPVYAFRPLNTG